MAYVRAANANPSLSVLIRDGEHDNTNSKEATERFALKCDTFAVNIGKTPIQIPIPGSSPELLDLGIMRPSVTISGVVDTVQPSPASLTITGETYKIPFKNQLENAVYYWSASDDLLLEVEVGDTTYPAQANSTDAYSSSVINSSSEASWTGGAIYRVAIQSARFGLSATKEDRYDFSMQFVAAAREDWVQKGTIS
jgi:hypothetical protein